MGFLRMGKSEEGSGRQKAWISEERFAKAVAFAKEHELFERLQNLYATIPEGQCGGCAACCQESVDTHWVEFLQIYDFLHQHPVQMQQILPEILRFFLLEGVEKRYCPFQLDGKRCAIYPVRPLPCRLFGQWGREDYEVNFAVTREQNRKKAGYYLETYGLHLPDEVVNPVLPYCDTFQKPQDLLVDDFYDLLDGMMAIQSRFLLAADEEMDEQAMNRGLISWLTGTVCDVNSLFPQKIAIMHEYLSSGTTRLLEEVVAYLLKNVDGSC